MARSLGYLPQPGMSAGAGVGSALGAFGQTMSNLGQLTIDDKKQKNDEALQNAKLTLDQNADKRGDEELKLNKDKFDYTKDETQSAKVERALKEKNMASAFRALHPNATKDLSDDEVKAWGNDIDKILPRSGKVEKIDARITPDGSKILTFMQDGQIVEKNMGKVKTDWNEGIDKPSSEIPEGSVAVALDYTKANLDKGTLKKTKDGRYYDSLDNVNQWEAKNPVFTRNPVFNQDTNAEQKPRQKFKLPPVEYTDEEKARDLEITGTIGSDGKKIKGKYTW